MFTITLARFEITAILPASSRLAQFTLDASDRPTRPKQVSPGLSVKETGRFSFAPAESRTFPLTGRRSQPLTGVKITHMFQRNTKLDLTFGYTIGQNALRTSVEGLSDVNPVTKRIELLPARFFNRTTDQKTLLPLVGSNRAFFRSRQSPQHWCAGKRGLSSTHLRAERGGGSTAELRVSTNVAPQLTPSKGD